MFFVTITDMATYVSLFRVKLMVSLCRWLARYIANGKEKIRKVCSEGCVQRGGNAWAFINFFIHLQFLEKDFLEDYLGHWEMEAEGMENMSQTEKSTVVK